jgi:twinkle protein
MVELPRTPEQADPIAQVKATVRIEDYVVLKMGLSAQRMRAGEWWFLCPLHKETTASFHIRLKEQDFKCFGCGKGGDVIDLEMAATGETNPRVAAEKILLEYGQFPIGPDVRFVGEPEPVKIRPMRMTEPAYREEDLVAGPAIVWLESRGIHWPVAKRNGVRTGKNYVEFPYVNDGEVVNRQTRTLSAKGFRFETGKPVIPFGLDDCDGQPEVVIVEGVMDKLAVEEATGRTAVLAMPNATPSSDCYALVGEATKAASKIIVAVDADEPGQKLRDELIRRLGADRCWTVDWGHGAYKDANDVLMDSGPEGLLSLLAEAAPMPVEGVFTVDDSWAAIERLYEEGMGKGASTGWANLDRYYTVRRKQLTVITGTPSSGKSVFADAMLMNLAKSSWEWKFAICSPEMQPLERHWAHLIGLWAGQPFGEGPTPRMDRETLRQAREFVRDKFYMILPEEPTVDGVMERFVWTHRRHGVHGWLIDPWNEMDHTRPNNMTETDYCNNQIRKIKRKLQNHDVWGGLIAHPRIQYRNKQTGRYDVPTLYDINGSAAFYNKADNGLVIVRDKGDETAPVEVHVQKVRFQEIGGLTADKPALFRHDKVTGQYREVTTW